jgi:hypothetical protein
MSVSSDERHKHVIIARRNKFISMAIASAGVAAGCAGCKPCLDVEPPPGHSANTSTPAKETSATKASNVPAKATSARDGGVAPKACLDFVAEKPDFD